MAGSSFTEFASRRNFFGCYGNQIALKDTHGKYIVALPNGAAMANETRVVKGTRFTVQDLGGDDNERTIALKTGFGKWLVAYPQPDYNVRANGNWLGPWEKFIVKHNDQGAYWFKTSQGRYLVGRTDGSLEQSEHIRRWEKFTPKCLGGSRKTMDGPSGVGSGYESGAGWGPSCRDDQYASLSYCRWAKERGYCEKQCRIRSYCKKTCDLCHTDDDNDCVYSDCMENDDCKNGERCDWPSDENEPGFCIKGLSQSVNQTEPQEAMDSVESDSRKTMDRPSGLGSGYESGAGWGPSGIIAI